MKTGRLSRTVGILLAAAGCAGFATVADDYRHTGELFGVGAILASGVALLVAGLDNRLTRRLDLRWAAIGIGVGFAAGLLTDEVPAGVSGGAVLGLLAAAWAGRGPHGHRSLWRRLRRQAG